MEIIEHTSLRLDDVANAVEGDSTRRLTVGMADIYLVGSPGDKRLLVTSNGDSVSIDLSSIR